MSRELLSPSPGRPHNLRADRGRIHLGTCRAAPSCAQDRRIRTRPYTPRTNGNVERYQQTLQREWAYALQYASSDARRASLPHWVRHYNEQRTHSALGNRPPIARVRKVTGHNT
jgi:transposase InsO family protein